MSLITKIFASFVLMIAIAVGAGVMGWTAVTSIDTTMNRIIEYELAAENGFQDLAASFQTITVAQRTLLNTNLPLETRADQHEVIQREKAAFDRIGGDINTLLVSGVGTVAGWDEVLDRWRTFSSLISDWNSAVDAGVDKLHAWENTTILSPDALLRDVMQYRGDHFQLAVLLGEMITREVSIGPEITSADNLCAFGQWRIRFENSEEVYSRNPVLRDAMNDITLPHREFHQSAAEVQELIADGFIKNQEQVESRYIEHLAAARKVIENFQVFMDEAERARRLFADAESFTMGDLGQIRSQSLEALEDLVNANNVNMARNFEVAIADGKEGIRTMQRLAVAALILGAMTMVYLYVTMRRHLTDPLTRVIAALAADADEVASEAGGVAISSTSLSEGSSDQAASLEETSAAIEEITSMARRNLENAKSANETMQDNAGQINESTRAVARMSNAMDEIKDSSERIGHILKTIEDIAFQTNLLALNAAVEAARAGEAGRGFAVVADEVRNLAQRSAQAVKDTAELITGTVERVNNGARITKEIETNFREIAASTERITRMIEEIDVATSEQTQGMELINQSVSRIDQVNQENSRHAMANAQASVNLNERSGDLMQQIGELKNVLRRIIGASVLVTAGSVRATIQHARRNRDVTAQSHALSMRGLKALPLPEDN